MPNKVAWISEVKNDKKPWGEVSAWNSNGHAFNKILKIEKGHRTSLKKYSIKSESFYLLSGKLSVLYGDEDTEEVNQMSTGLLSEGQVLTVPSGCPYRLEALEDSVVIESSSHGDSSFIIIEDDYNR